MFKKFVGIILTLALITSLTSCETVRRKFVRKKKAKPVRPMFYKEVEGEVKRPPIEAYMTHYVYLKTWMDDLINNAGQNKKRDRHAVSEAMANLEDMKKYLTGDKKEELDKYLTQTKRVTDKMLIAGLNDARLGMLKQELGKIRRRITQKFYYKKVREYISKD